MFHAALTGVVLGVTARLLMRVAALISESEDGSNGEFDPGASVMIVALFVAAAVGAWLGARLFARWRNAGMVVAGLALVPLWLPGASIAGVEVSSRVGGPLLETAGVIVVALAIVACMVGAPLLGWRAGRGDALRHNLSVTAVPR